MRRLIIGHWTLVIGVAADWGTRHGGGLGHDRPGYPILAIVAVRML